MAKKKRKKINPNNLLDLANWCIERVMRPFWKLYDACCCISQSPEVWCDNERTWFISRKGKIGFIDYDSGDLCVAYKGIVVRHTGNTLYTYFQIANRTSTGLQTDKSTHGVLFYKEEIIYDGRAVGVNFCGNNALINIDNNKGLIVTNGEILYTKEYDEDENEINIAKNKANRTCNAMDGIGRGTIQCCGEMFYVTYSVSGYSYLLLFGRDNKIIYNDRLGSAFPYNNYYPDDYPLYTTYPTIYNPHCTNGQYLLFSDESNNYYVAYDGEILLDANPNLIWYNEPYRYGRGITFVDSETGYYYIFFRGKLFDRKGGYTYSQAEKDAYNIQKGKTCSSQFVTFKNISGDQNWDWFEWFVFYVADEIYFRLYGTDKDRKPKIVLIATHTENEKWCWGSFVDYDYDPSYLKGAIQSVRVYLANRPTANGCNQYSFTNAPCKLVISNVSEHTDLFPTIEYNPDFTDNRLSDEMVDVAVENAAVFDLTLPTNDLEYRLLDPALDAGYTSVSFPRPQYIVYNDPNGNQYVLTEKTVYFLGRNSVVVADFDVGNFKMNRYTPSTYNDDNRMILDNGVHFSYTENGEWGYIRLKIPTQSYSLQDGVYYLFLTNEGNVKYNTSWYNVVAGSYPGSLQPDSNAHTFTSPYVTSEHVYYSKICGGGDTDNTHQSSIFVLNDDGTLAYQFGPNGRIVRNAFTAECRRWRLGHLITDPDNGFIAAPDSEWAPYDPNVLATGLEENTFWGKPVPDDLPYKVGGGLFCMDYRWTYLNCCGGTTNDSVTSFYRANGKYVTSATTTPGVSETLRDVGYVGEGIDEIEFWFKGVLQMRVPKNPESDGTFFKCCPQFIITPGEDDDYIVWYLTEDGAKTWSFDFEALPSIRQCCNGLLWLEAKRKSETERTNLFIGYEGLFAELPVSTAADYSILCCGESRAIAVNANISFVVDDTFGLIPIDMFNLKILDKVRETDFENYNENRIKPLTYEELEDENNG